MTIELGVGLMLTEYCPFKCRHCMFSCSNHKPKAYMSDETICRIARQWRELCWAIDHGAVYPGMNGVQDFEMGSVNLVGGEPTADLDEFKRCLETAHQEFGTITTIEMTTNGWWLAKPKTAYRFMEIVAPYVDSNGGGDNFRVRISGTRYHDEFRPEWLRGKKRLEGKLQAIFWGENCPEELMDSFLAPEPNANFPWIYVDDDLDIDQLTPVGRAANFGTGANTSRRAFFSPSTYCGPNALLYDVQGNLRDICCRGSKTPFGNADDNPVLLYMLGKAFISECKPNCHDCHEMAKEWQKTHLTMTKEQFEREILMEVAYA